MAFGAGCVVAVEQVARIDPLDDRAFGRFVTAPCPRAEWSSGYRSGMYGQEQASKSMKQAAKSRRGMSCFGVRLRLVEKGGMVHKHTLHFQRLC